MAKLNFKNCDLKVSPNTALFLLATRVLPASPNLGQAKHGKKVSTILVHPTRRQIFAGKSDSTFYNIWDLLISQRQSTQLFYAFAKHFCYFYFQFWASAKKNPKYISSNLHPL